MTIDDNSAERPEQGASSVVTTPMARRRLMKSALGTPVVLSSLASKPVLGGPHGSCTGSNFGSFSPNSHSTTDCSGEGQSATYWQTTEWPTKQIKTSTAFNGFRCGSQSLLAAFYKNKTGGGTRSATMLEVLNDNNALGRATVVSLLNTYWRAGSYPVTDVQIVQMFNAASTLQDYPVGSGSKLTPQQVLAYLESLYPRG